MFDSQLFAGEKLAEPGGATTWDRRGLGLAVGMDLEEGCWAIVRASSRSIEARSNASSKVWCRKQKIKVSKVCRAIQNSQGAGAWKPLFPGDMNSTLSSSERSITKEPDPGWPDFEHQLWDSKPMNMTHQVQMQLTSMHSSFYSLFMYTQVKYNFKGRQGYHCLFPLWACHITTGSAGSLQCFFRTRTAVASWEHMRWSNGDCPKTSSTFYFLTVQDLIVWIYSYLQFNI